MQPLLRIELLGGFQLYHGDAPLIVNSTSLQSLFAYLVTQHHAPQPRRQIAFLLWPDSTEAQAYANLRRELHTLRRVVPDPDRYLVITHASLQWRTDAAFSLDVMDFTRLLAEAERMDATRQAAERGRFLQQAIERYHGPLLPNCYDEWILPRREELEQAYVRALEQLAAILEDQRDYAAAIRATEQLLQHDRLTESTYRRLMRLYVINRERARALRVYHDCCALLEQELGVEPSIETQLLYAQLLQADAPKPDRTSKSKSLAVSTALVGRQRAWQQLLRAYRLASDGHARMVLISGEAGIGKSRLAEELVLLAEQQGILTAKSRGYMAQGSLAYAPIVEILRAASLLRHWSKLADAWLEQLVWLLPELREMRPTLASVPVQIEQWRRRGMIEALARALLAGDELRVFVIDDLQWCDHETIVLLQYLLNFAPRSRLLVIGTARPEEITRDHPLAALRHSLLPQDQLTELEIGPLSATETASLAAQVAGGEHTPAAMAQIYQQTEGNPLYIVEAVRTGLIQALLGSETQPHQELVAPQTASFSPRIYAMIQARLAQLSPDTRKLASIAATIGRSFTFDVLVRASGEPEAAVVNGLDELWQRRIIRAQGVNAYDFSHDRIRDVAYAEISPVRLPQLHRRVAQALEEVYADDLDAVASQLAVHYEQAGQVTNAIEWYERAAEIHRRMYAAVDESRHLQAALTLLATLPDTPDRTRTEISLLIALMLSEAIAHGLAAPGRLQAATRARDLLRKDGNQRQHFHVLDNLHNFHCAHYGVHTAHSMTQEIIDIANNVGDPLIQILALRCKARSHRALGEFNEAYSSQQKARESYSHAILNLEGSIGSDWTNLAVESSALDLCLLGYLDQARIRMDRVVAASQELNPFTLTNLLFTASLIYRILENVDKVQELGQRMLTLGLQYELPMSIWSGQICQGWVFAMQGDLATGIAQMEEGTECFWQVGHTMYQTFRMGGLAEFYLQANRPDAAETILHKALELSNKAHERFWDAEIYRLYGKLVQARGEAETVIEQHYLRAYEVARTQHAKTLELRAATSLARLWQKQGASTRAYEVLAETVNWFTEGFDWGDYQVAKALLGELISTQDV